MPEKEGVSQALWPPTPVVGKLWHEGQIQMTHYVYGFPGTQPLPHLCLCTRDGRLEWLRQKLPSLYSFTYLLSALYRKKKMAELWSTPFLRGDLRVLPKLRSALGGRGRRGHILNSKMLKETLLKRKPH